MLSEIRKHLTYIGSINLHFDYLSISRYHYEQFALSIVCLSVSFSWDKVSSTEFIQKP